MAEILMFFGILVGLVSILSVALWPWAEAHQKQANALRAQFSALARGAANWQRSRIDR